MTLIVVYDIKYPMNLRDGMGKAWFAIYTKSHFEKKVNDILTKKRVTTFLPLRRAKTKIAGSFTFADVPLFRSYLFININLNSEEYYDVLDTTGVSCVVKRGKTPCPVSYEVIESLQKLVEEMKDEISVITGIKRGERVRIMRGPLKGTVGDMLEIDNKKCRFIVNVDILGRAVQTLIPPDYVIRV